MRKLMWYALGFGVSAVIGMYFLWEKWYFLAAGMTAVLLAVSLTLMTRLPKVRIGAMILAGAIAGFCWMFLFDSFYLAIPREADGKRMELSITVTDYPVATEQGSAVNGYGWINGRPYAVWVHLPKEMDLHPGDVITSRYHLRCTLPGSGGQSSYQRSHGSFLTAVSYREPDLTRPEKMPFIGYPAAARQSIRQTLYLVLPRDVAGFAAALLIGDGDGLTYEMDQAFRISGIRHIIAVSGLHVTILFSLISLLMGKRRVLAALVGIPVLFFFAAVAGFSPSITRACIMHGLMALAMLFDKEYDPPTALGFAVLVMLTVNPWTVTHVGFQMSVGCMIGIFLFADRIRQWLMEKKRLGRFRGGWKKAANAFAVSVGMSLGAAIAVTPLSAYYFKMVSLLGVVTNLLTLWIVSFIFYGIIAALVLGFVWVPAAKLLGCVIAWPMRYIMQVAVAISKIPFAAVYTDSVYVVMWLVFCYLLLGIYLLMKKKQPLIFACYAAIGLSVVLTVSWVPPRYETSMAVLDVGQGQCILLHSEGKTYMVDCGGDSDTDAAEKAAHYLLSRGIFRLDGLILTHYDRDHAAGAAYLLERIPADMLYLPNCSDIDGTMETLGRNPVQRRLLVGHKTEITFGDTRIQLIPSQNEVSDNESGLCVLFQSENCDILITGDRSAAGERELLRQIDLPKLEVLIVGHHGSKNATCRQLLEAGQPDYAFVSVGAYNSYGHPAEEVLKRLEEAGCVIRRTDQIGTIIYKG